MHYFQYLGGTLHCEGVPLPRIAEAVGTPTYIYSERTLERHVRVFQEAFAEVPHLICYAIKANSNLSLLRRLAEWGTGFDIVSAGELFRALRSGGDPSRIIFSGVGKTADEVRYALDSGILFFNIESVSELDEISAIATAAGRTARISIRTNPNVDPKTHPYISTGMQKHKFGVQLDEAAALYGRARALPGLEIVGTGCHIGSQITEMSPFEEALASLRSFVLQLRSDGHPLKYLDFGGGLGVPYNDEQPPPPSEYGAAIVRATRDLGLTLVLEPGRVLVGNAGVLLTRVIRQKSQGSKNFVIVDAAMNDLIRPALYRSFHQLWPVRQAAPDDPTTVADIVGPVCESADFLAQDRQIPVPVNGDLLSVMTAGAYGFALSSNYNSRPRAAEVLVRDETFRVVRRRETFDDLIGPEEGL